MKQSRKQSGLFSLFLIFFKIGFFTFGGGYAMISQIKEIVEKNDWLTEEELMEIIAVSESTPGPLAINLATYVGYRRGGFWGSLLATLGVTLPSLLIIYLISLVLERFMENKYVAYAFVGVKCAVSFLILKAGVEFFLHLEKKPLPLITFGVVFLAMLMLELFSLSFSTIVFLLAGGVIGIFVYGVIGAKGDGKK